MGRLRGFFWRCWHRGYNRWADAVALVAGACNRSTWDGEGYAGGYAHWRCGRRRGHEGLHRFENYVWGGRVCFDPLPVLGRLESQGLRDREIPFWRVTRKRYLIDTLRRARVRRQAIERETAARGEGVVTAEGERDEALAVAVGLAREATAAGLVVTALQPHRCLGRYGCHFIQLWKPDGGLWAEGSHESTAAVWGHIASYGRGVVGDEWPVTVEEAARNEQVRLWGDLEGAVRSAAGGCWSVGCEGVAYRIQALARLVGAAPWEQVGVGLLRSGVYERVLREVGVEPGPIDWDVVARCEARIAESARAAGGAG